MDQARPPLSVPNALSRGRRPALANARPPLLSVIIPVHNGRAHLLACLNALQASDFKDFEIILIDDASTEDLTAVPSGLPVRWLRLVVRQGPAAARNRGAEAARGDYLLFIDSDVRVHPETLGQVVAAFADCPEVAAVFGSYDASPREPNLCSQYKNLLHHFVHQEASERAWTFWTGCGAIRRSVFLAAGGFDPAYERPCIEDIELGVRLNKTGHRVALKKHIQVTHLKRWTLAGIVRTDLWDRAVPWTELLLRERILPNDLNLKLSHRVCTLLAWTMLLLAPAAWAVVEVLSLLAGLLAALVLLNGRFYRFLLRQRGLGFAARVVPLHILYYLCCGAGFLIGAGRFLTRTRPVPGWMACRPCPPSLPAPARVVLPPAPLAGARV